MTFVASHFLKAYLIHLHEQKKEIPRVDRSLIRNVYKTISKKTTGPKSKNVELLASLEEFYRLKLLPKLIDAKEDDPEISKEKLEEYKYSAINLSYVIGEETISMEVAYQEHIKRNFVKFLRQFVNQMFKKEHQKIIDDFDGSKREIRNRLKYELKKVKEALVNDTLECEPKYHKWLKKYRSKILPTEYSKSHELEIQRRPHRYQKHLIFMSQTLEKEKLKTFQAVPLRTDVKDKYVAINTRALLDIFPFPHKTRYTGITGEHAYELWTMFFNLKPLKINKKILKGLHFNNRIETDGYAVSVSFVTTDELSLKKQRCDRMFKASTKARQEYSGKSFAEIEEMKEKKRIEREEKDIETAAEKKKRLAAYRKKYRQMKKEEQEKLKTESRLKGEFCYIGDMIKVADHLRDLKKFRQEQRLVYLDPGKKSIGTFMSDQGEFFNYRSRRRIKETKRTKYNHLIEYRKARTRLEVDDGAKTVRQMEAELTEFSKKSSVLDTFFKYVRKKMIFWKAIKKENSYQKYLQKLNWFQYINTRKHENRILNELQEKFGRNAVIVTGDWSGKGNIKHISTPGIGFRRKLAERFRVHLVDEYKTSILNCHTKEIQKNLRLSVNGKERRLHSVLTYQMGNKRIGCINRDRNAVRNMREIVHSLIDEGVRPEAFQRTKSTKSPSPRRKSSKTSV